MDVVPFQPPFGDDVVRLIVSIQRDEFGIDITAEQQPDLRDIPGYYQVGAGNFWVAVADGRVVGTIALLDIGNHQGALRKMFVRREFRGPGTGAATRLLETLLEWAGRHAVRDLFLGTTAQFLAAHRFYEKHGFAEIDRSALPSGFPVMRVDTKFFHRAAGTTITAGGLDDPRVQALLARHFRTARAQTAAGSAHALDLGELQSPAIQFWAAWDGDRVVGIGALKRLSGSHGEVKSMHTAESHRGRGVGGAMLRHIIAVARRTGLSRLSLETGSWPYFDPARALYRRHGFVECAAFGDYVPDPNSVFMTLALEEEP